MTIDQLIEQLQTLSDSGHGSERAYTLGVEGYDVVCLPVTYVGGHWLYSDRKGVWSL